MKLTVFVDQIFWFDGERYSTDEAFIKFVTAFEPYFDKIILCGRVSDQRKTERYVLDPSKTEVCALPFYKDLYALWKEIVFVLPKVFSIVNREIRDWDLVWLCVPHPFALVYAYLCEREKKPFFLYVRQNLVEMVRHRSSGAKKIAAIALASLLEKRFVSLAKRHITFTIGREVYQAYSKNSLEHVFEATCSLISKKDVELSRTLRKQDMIGDRKIHLLCVSRLDPEKGLEHLIQAMHILRQQIGREVELHLVGSGQMEQPLRRQVSQLGLDQNVLFHGYVTHSQFLFDLYRTASVFILHSLTEGVPQVLLEAMACGVPIVATNVGGIPHIITDGFNGLLIAPASPRQISDAIFRLIADKPLRERLIANAYQFVLKHTLEDERNRMLTVLQQYRLWPQ